MAHRRGGFHRAGARKRPVTWISNSEIPIFGKLNTVALGSNSSVATGIPSEVDQTLIRLRGELLLTSLIPVATVEHTTIGIGLGIAPFTGQALSTSYPRALLDADWDGWLYYSTHSFRNAGANLTEGVHVREAFESKAMRKIQAKSIIFISFETVNADPVETSTVNFVVPSRALIKVN